MLRAVIFDFDGVITDSEVLHFRSFNKILADFGIVITLKDYYKNYLGLSDFDLFSLLVSKGRLRLKELTVEDLIKKKNVIFEKLAKTEGQIIEGVRPFIEMLG
ncbi:MAG: HAD family phosphatase, partial [Phycisphaerae bacterium]|nr:HAD family phosphatase [Phycisphaerae bacterium]